MFFESGNEFFPLISRYTIFYLKFDITLLFFLFSKIFLLHLFISNFIYFGIVEHFEGDGWQFDFL
jgi:hypothetical protein